MLIAGELKSRTLARQLASPRKLMHRFTSSLHLLRGIVIFIEPNWHLAWTTLPSLFFHYLYNLPHCGASSWIQCCLDFHRGTSDIHDLTFSSASPQALTSFVPSFLWCFVLDAASTSFTLVHCSTFAAFPLVSIFASSKSGFKDSFVALGALCIRGSITTYLHRCRKGLGLLCHERPPVH